MGRELKFPNMLCDISLCRDQVEELAELITFCPEACKLLKLHWPPVKEDFDQQLRAALDELEQFRRDKVRRDELIGITTVNGKSPEQIKAAMCICIDYGCGNYRCSYEEYGDCIESMKRDSLEYIKQLEAKLSERSELLANLGVRPRSEVAG